MERVSLPVNLNISLSAVYSMVLLHAYGYANLAKLYYITNSVFLISTWGGCHCAQHANGGNTTMLA